MKAPNPEALDASVVGAENPWPGLLSFSEADQRWFQGRREETAELLQLIKRERLTVLYALSGLGKSSLLQAGLFPALRREAMFPIYIRLDYAAENQGLRLQVFESIAQAGLAADVKVPVARPGETLWEYFHSLQAEFWNRQQRRVLPILVFDQFEEIFTLGKGENRAHDSEAFLEELAELAEGTIPPSVADRWSLDPSEKDDYTEEGEYKLLLSLREDFLPELIDQNRRIARVSQKRYRLHQMNGESGLLAVSQAKDLVDEAVATQIVRYVAGGDRVGSGRGRPLKYMDVEPALLSVVCRELNNRRRQRGERKISADLLEGSQELVLSDFYERSFDGMPPPVRAFVEERLITVGGRRDSVAEESALAELDNSTEIIEQLVERRLIRREYRRKEAWLELTHDLLTGVVRASRDARRQEEALEKQRREAAASRAKVRRLRWVTAGMAAATVLFAGVALVAYRAQLEAKRQTALGQSETERAEAQAEKASVSAKIADERTKFAYEKAKEAEEQTQRALKAIQNEQAATKLKDQFAVESKRKDAEKLTAINQRLEEQAGRMKAVEGKAKADAELLAKTKENSNLSLETIDLKAKQLALARKKLAENLVGDITAKVAAGQSGQSLGSIARALFLDQSSLAARSWAFDQLLRGSWRAPVAAGTSGAELFVRPALAHPNGVLSAVFSPDQRMVATTALDNGVRLWDWETSRLAGELNGHDKVVNTIAFSPDGRRIVTASLDKTARVWDVASRRQLLALSHDEQVTSAAFSADGRRIVTTSQDKTAQVWDAENGAKSGAPVEHPMTVKFAAFSRDGRMLVTACTDRKARVWNLSDTTRPLFEMPHQGEVNSASFSPDGTRVVTASSDFTARLWSVSARGPSSAEVMKHSGAVYSAVFSGDGLRVATASRDSTARVWEASSGRAITAPLSHDGPVLSAAFSSDNRRLVTASSDKKTRVWDVWYPFDGAEDLIKLAEAISGINASQDDVSAELPHLSEPERQRRMNELRAKANQQGSNATFLKWFFAHRQ